MKLVWNWRQAWRMWSIQGLIVIGFIQGVLLTFPPEWAVQPIPLLGGFTWVKLGQTLTILASAITGLGRIIDQGHVTKPPEEPL